MYDLNFFRENFFCFSLRTVCLIFGFFDFTFWILISIQKHDNHVQPFIKDSVIVIGEIQLISLYYGVLREKRRILWIFIGSSATLALGASSVFYYSLFTLITVATTFEYYYFMLLILSAILFWFLITHIFVVRNFQAKLCNLDRIKSF